MSSFDINHFKRNMKQWVDQNPEGPIDAFVDYCEDMIPQHQYTAYQWLIEQAEAWYQNISIRREIIKYAEHD